MQTYVKALNKLYLEHPALYEQDYAPEGFEWINCSYQKESMVMFLRRSRDAKETLLFVCNFDTVDHEKFRVGVPFAGKYKEILNSDSKEFGGNGLGNARVKTAKKLEWDEREYSIEIHIPPMSCLVFSCTPEPVKEKEKKKTGKAAAKPGKSAAASAPKAKPEKSAAAPEVKPKAEPEKLTTAKQEPEKLATAKKEPHKVATAKKEPEKLATAKKEPHKVATAKKEPEKLATAKQEPEKLATAKKEPHKVATAKKEPEKLATAKKEPEKLATAKKEPEKLEEKK